MGVSKNNGKTPQIIHLFIGFGTMIFTFHFGGKNHYFWKYLPIRKGFLTEKLPLGARTSVPWSKQGAATVAKAG